jgi:hypothetical protein
VKQPNQSPSNGASRIDGRQWILVNGLLIMLKRHSGVRMAQKRLCIFDLALNLVTIFRPLRDGRI